MPQGVIEDYFGLVRAPPETRSHFLALPRSIRENIYLMANLGPHHSIGLNRRALQRCPSIGDADEELDTCPDEGSSLLRYYEGRGRPDPLPLSLLFVCKSISSEVQDILYGHNYFSISQRSRGGLRALELLSAQTISKLQFLIIHLTPCRCIEPHCVRRPRQTLYDEQRSPFLYDTRLPNPMEEGHDRRLSNMSRTDKGILEQWERVWSRFAAHVLPGKLKLFIVCHVQDKHVAAHVVQPLLQLPTLRDCGIYLGPLTHSDRGDLQSVAKMTVQCLTTSNSRATTRPFQFPNLPKELQFQVLSASILVLDFRVNIRAGRYDKRILQHNCEKDEITNEGEPPIETFYFCPKYCAAFRAVCDSGKYTCLTQIFCVSKYFGEMAKEIFFSKNSFIIYTWAPRTTWQDTRDLTGVYKFLSGLPPHDLRFIRRLSIMLPPIDERSLSDESLDWKSWQESIQILANKTTRSRLVLAIKIGDYTSDRERRDRNNRFDEKCEKGTFQVYEEIVRPLIQLRGLKALFIDVPCPFEDDREGERVESERKLEQMVMGPNYDAYAMGKPQHCAYTRPFLDDRFA